MQFREPNKGENFSQIEERILKVKKYWKAFSSERCIVSDTEYGEATK
jgi:hypothetical protein